MPYERTGYAPWSLTREAGVQSATVDGTLKVPQYGQPTIDIGFIDEKGNWQGRKSSDLQFIGHTKALGIADGGEALFPETNNFPSINMDGWTGLQIALLVSNTGNYGFSAVQGPDANPVNGLSPVDSGEGLKWIGPSRYTDATFDDVLLDTSEGIIASKWKIFTIIERITGQSNLQFKITNSSGGNSDIEFAFRRLV